jgi:hypothetical protein
MSPAAVSGTSKAIQAYLPTFKAAVLTEISNYLAETPALCTTTASGWPAFGPLITMTAILKRAFHVLRQATGPAELHWVRFVVKI